MKLDLTKDFLRSITKKQKMYEIQHFKTIVPMKQ